MKHRCLLLLSCLLTTLLASAPVQARPFVHVLPAAVLFGMKVPLAPDCTAGAFAQDRAVMPVNKTLALLGGAPSQMDLILRRQAGVALPEPAAAPAVEVVEETASCHEGAPISGTVAAAPGAAVELLPNIPGEFLSSRRLAITRTAFDGRWKRVSHATLGDRTLRQLGIPGAALPVTERLRAVNVWANAHVRYVEDRAGYGEADYWATSRETLRRGQGDCEDIAILKLQLLAAAGVPRDAMFLTIARDLARNSDHAMLIVRVEDRFWLLDNATDALVDATTAQDYRPIFSFSQNGKWLHGYSERLARAQNPLLVPDPAPALAPSLPLPVRLSVR